MYWESVADMRASMDRSVLLQLRDTAASAQSVLDSLPVFSHLFTDRASYRVFERHLRHIQQTAHGAAENAAKRVAESHVAK